MADDSSVRVALRVRPQIPREIIDMCRVCTSVTPGEPQVWLGNDKAFTFDYVFDIDSVQASIYDACISDLIEGCFDGFNATVLAYGQTGSGKTYTMGTGFDMNVSDDEYGIIPRAVDHLFQGIEERQKAAINSNQSPPEFKVVCQFMEIYNEEVIDLFDTTQDSYSRGRKSNIRIQEDPNEGICIIGLSNKIVSTKHETMQCLKVGALSRTTASTQMNVQSSRSHAVFTLHIKQQRLVTCDDPISDMNDMSEFETLTAKFHFVDLAGSERLKRTGATGDRAKEGISINCGLLALGNVISALGDKTKRGSHVPYRDSKLTRLLQDSLGGNSRTVMIACISPSDRDFMETLNTLKYANRARNIKNKITVNQDKTSQMVSSLRTEIQRLQLELLEYKQSKDPSLSNTKLSRFRNVDGDGEEMGKRLIVDGVESVNDMYHENTMLQTENNHLRTRIKAMQETLEQLKANNIQLLTEKSVSNWITADNANGDMTQLIQGYLKEIEDLRAKLLEAENTCQILRRAASRTHSILSPRPQSAGNFESFVDADEAASVDDLLESAKLNIVRLKRRERRFRSKPKASESENEQPGEEQEKDDAKSEDEGSDDGEEMSDLSSESDSEEKENAKLEEDLADLTCEISIKQKLIEELERSQRRLYTLRQQYEEKLMQLKTKMRATQEERDKMLSNFGNLGNQGEEKVKKVKEEYEKKLNSLQNEMRKLQEAKKRHAQLLKNQSQYEQQLKTMRSELADMKKAKVRLLNKMKEESVKHKESEVRRNREIAQLKKESRQHENQIRTLTAEKRMKETILRRKQEEVSALRKMVKPMSDKVAGRTAQTRSKLSAFETKRTFSAKLAKVKWQSLENGITKLSLHRQAVSNLEKNMEHYLEERNKLRRYIEKLVKKRDRVILQGKDEMIKYYEDQIESAKVNIDYVQENISECQTNIMQMEEPKEGADITDASHLLTGLGFEDVKYVVEKLLLFALNQSTSAVQKDTKLKEVEASMQQIVKNSTLQEQLLEHVLASKDLEYEFTLFNLHDEPEPALSSGSSRSVSPAESSVSHSEAPLVNSILNADAAVRRSMRDKVRRRTATPEELLGHCVPSEAFTQMSPIVDEPDLHESPKTSHEHQEQIPQFSNGIPRVPSAPGSLKMMAAAANGRTTEGCWWPPFSSPVLGRREPPPKPPDAASRPPQGMLLNNNVGVPRRMTRSFESNPESSPPSSPMVSRKNREDNVFSRLTSQSSPLCETNRDRGVIMPYGGRLKTAPLVCTHVAEGHSKAVLSVDATDDLLFSASKDRTVKIWDLHTSTELETLEGHPSNVTTVKYSATTNQVFSVSSSFVKVWDIREHPRKCIRTLNSLGLITHTTSSGSSRPMSSSNGKELQINDIALSQNGMTLFSASGNIVRVWDLRKFLCTGKLNGGHQAAVMCLAVSDDFKKNSLVVTGSKDHYIKVFEVAEGIGGMHTPRLNLEPPHYDGIESLTMTGCYLFSGSRDMCIKKWDLSGSELLKQSLNQAHKDWVCGLQVLPGGQVLVSGCRGGYLKLWSVETCAQLGEIKAHANPINSLATNSSSVFSASSDGTIGIWRMKNMSDSMEYSELS